jgi:uncharacterized protein YutE (UPF0331/DUF86 family)
MTEPWSGIERRLERLEHCAGRLEALSSRPPSDFPPNSELRDLAERNFEIAAQCVIDIAMRIISIEHAPRTSEASDAIRQLATLRVLPQEFAHGLAPLAGFRNVLVHEYVDIDWDLVHDHFRRLPDLRVFADHTRAWLRGRMPTP